VHDIFERPAKWDMYDFKEVAKIKDCKVALEITHCHKDWEDVTAKIMYFFEVSFDLNGEKEIVLSKDKSIVIISASTLNEAAAKSVSPLCEKVPERKFTFKMTRQEKLWYKERRKKKNLHDKKFYERKNWGKNY
ncbi:MAG: hypothetical protein IJO44_06780, partial [Clostridia bacterium]|nr:hypothetical protein [Clostridia bacterium]